MLTTWPKLSRIKFFNFLFFLRLGLIFFIHTVKVGAKVNTNLVKSLRRRMFWGRGHEFKLIREWLETVTVCYTTGNTFLKLVSTGANCICWSGTSLAELSLHPQTGDRTHPQVLKE